MQEKVVSTQTGSSKMNSVPVYKTEEEEEAASTQKS